MAMVHMDSEDLTRSISNIVEIAAQMGYSTREWHDISASELAHILNAERSLIHDWPNIHPVAAKLLREIQEM